MMETALHSDDLQTLQDRLRAMLMDLPLDLQCSSREGALMVVGQHPADAGLEPRDLLRTLERAIQRLQVTFVPQARLYLRVAGEPRPYAQRFFLIQPPPPPLRLLEPTPPSLISPAPAAPPPPAAPAIAPPSLTLSEESAWVVSDAELDTLLQELVGDISLDAFLPAPGDELTYAWPEAQSVATAAPVATADPLALADIPPDAVSPDLLPPLPAAPIPEDSIPLETAWPDLAAALWPPAAASDALPTPDDPAAPPPTAASMSLIPYPLAGRLLAGEWPDLGDTQAEDAPASRPQPGDRPYLERRVLLTGGAIALGVAGGVYGLSRPCVLGNTCTALETAVGLQAESVSQAEAATDADALAAARQPLQRAIATLETIPVWSRYGGQARQLEDTYSTQADTLDRLMAIAELGTTAQQTREDAPLSLESWQTVVRLWDSAIDRLDAIQPTSPYYRTAQDLQQQYRRYWVADRRQLAAEQEAQSILAMARQGIEMATAREQIATTADQWQLVRITWQVVVNRLNQVPAGSYAAIEAQRLLQGYEPRLAAAIAQQAQEATATDLLNQAKTLAAEAEASAQQANWEGAIAAWNDAIRRTEQVPSTTAQATQAAELSRLYATAISQAEAKLELNNAIAQEIDRVCNQEFQKCQLVAVGQTVRVNLSPAYLGAIAQARDSGNRDLQAIVAEHQLTLRKSLEELAARFRLPIEVYDDNNTLLDRHNPQANTAQ